MCERLCVKSIKALQQYVPASVTCVSQQQATMSGSGRVMVYGGKGTLGSTLVSHYKANNWWVVSVGFTPNPEADTNVIVGREDSLEQQHNKVSSQLQNALAGKKLDAVLCVAEGWAGGNAQRDLIKSFEHTWRRNVWSSLIAAEMAATYLREGGLLTLTGNKDALEATPNLIGYGMSKCAVHHLTKSLGCEGSGMPRNSTTVAVLPIMLDTPRNRQGSMHKAKGDFSTLTPLSYLAETYFNWSTGKERPMNGSLLQVVTANSRTKMIPVNTY